jgi:hypothetical protein
MLIIAPLACAVTLGAVTAVIATNESQRAAIRDRTGTGRRFG